MKIANIETRSSDRREQILITRPLFGMLLSRKSLFLDLILLDTENDVFRIYGERKRHHASSQPPRVYYHIAAIFAVRCRPYITNSCWFIKTIPSVLAPCLVYRTICHVLAKNHAIERDCTYHNTCSSTKLSNVPRR
jgi:hypothetical protein